MPEYVEGVQYPFVHRAFIALEMALAFIWTSGTQYMASEGMEPTARIVTSLAAGAIMASGAGVAVDRGVKLAHAFLNPDQKNRVGSPKSPSGLTIGEVGRLDVDQLEDDYLNHRR